MQWAIKIEVYHTSGIYVNYGNSGNLKEPQTKNQFHR